MDILLRKVANGGFLPSDDTEGEKVRRFKAGAIVRAKVTQMRNYEFHKKFFAMLQVGFEAWEPPELEHHGLPAQKNLERFRKDCIIAAGHYDPVVNLGGDVRAEPHSMSFAAMDQAQFEQLYSDVANVLLDRVLRHYTREDLDRVVNEMLAFL